MLGTRISTGLFIAALVFLAAVAALASDGRGAALAASGCADIDGDGVVHAMDITYVGNYFGQTVPPAPPQVDMNKDGTMAVGDFGTVIGAFDNTTSCQTSPLPKTTMAGGALTVDANGEDATPADTMVDSSRYVLLGSGSFHVSVRLGVNPGIVAYQARLHWDEAVLDLNPRTAFDNDVWTENDSGVEPRASVQVLGPADDGSGSDSYVEIVTAPFKLPQTSVAVVPLAQFEFTCTSTGTATIALSDAGSHTQLVDFPLATEYMPTLTSAQVICLEPDADDDMDGCTNARELGPNELLGGRRDPLSHWDFIDLWTGNPLAQDKIISVGDIGASVARFGRQRAGGPPTKQEALAEALTPPTNQNGYHASADRNGVLPGDDLWDLQPPDGVMGVGDIGAVVRSFGHSCL